VGELQIVTKTVIWPPTRSHLRANTSVQKLASQYFNMYFFVTFFLICFLVIGLKRKKLFYSTGCASCFVFGFRRCEIHENELNPITNLRADTRNDEVAGELYDE
ncbi:MAG: hypothetical protein ACK56I_00875, partial [bacterium]